MEGESLTWIAIENLRFHMPLGVHDWEQESGTDVEITVRAAYDALRASVTGSLECAVDYARICDRIAEICNEPCRLAEHLAEKIVMHILRENPPLQVVEVEISKLKPLVAGDPRCFKVFRRVRKQKETPPQSYLPSL
ncbi:MAG: dihydroneopterin aldolase [Flavobacteriales bacterium]|nr:dihydroneopterin aldolase [Flavobacteriales bacterium]MDW8432981.1 dihydroneopterin aldolase [Flavobacteriales bacterium]